MLAKVLSPVRGSPKVYITIREAERSPGAVDVDSEAAVVASSLPWSDLPLLTATTDPDPGDA